MKLPKLPNPFKKSSGEDDEDDDYDDEEMPAPPAGPDADADLDDDDDEYDDDELDEGGRRKKQLVIAGAVVLVAGVIGGAAWWFLDSGDGGDAAETAARGRAPAPERGAGKGPRVEMSLPARPGSLGALTVPPRDGAGLKQRTQAPQGAASRPMAAPTGGAAATDTAGGPNLARTVGDIGGRFGGRANPLSGSLNAAGVVREKGTGVVIPAVTSGTIRALPDDPGGKPLGPTPDARLVEKVEGSEDLLPIISKDGDEAWKVYGRPFIAEHEDWPRVGIVIVELGLSRAATMSAITKLPPQVTLAISPYARDPKDWLVRARLVGHEVMVMLPLESDRFPVQDGGPYSLDTGLKAEENASRLTLVLSRFAGYTGVVTSLGSRFGTSEKMMRPVIEALKNRGLLFLAAGEQRDLAGPKIGEEIGLARVLSDLTLDAEQSRDAIDAKLERLEEIIRDRGRAAAVAHAYPSTLARLIPWLKSLEGKKIALVPVSALADTSKKGSE